MTLDPTFSRPRALRLRVPLRRLRLLVVAAMLAAVLAGGWLWLRDSPLVAVRHVDISGAPAADGARVEAALRAAAAQMTTLHVREQTLRDAAAPFASVATVRAHADFPHRLVIQVVQRRAVAAVQQPGGARVAVTADGRTLPDVPVATLPDVDVPPGPRTRAALSVAEAAPAPLLARAARFSWGAQGLELELRDGPPLIFGSAADARAKWAAAARVLADPSATGATYLDLRLPGRVAAGGLAPVAAEDPNGDSQTNPQPQGENTPSLNP
jgi:cell division protein FtsQ